MPRADGPFGVLEKVNDNTFKLDSLKDYTMSPTFNVRDLTPYLEDSVEAEDGVDLRATLFQQGEDDVPHHGRSDLNSPREEESGSKSSMVQEKSYKVTITRSRAKFVNLVTWMARRIR